MIQSTSTQIERKKCRSNDGCFFINILPHICPVFLKKSFGNSLSNKNQNIWIFPHVTQIRSISKNMHSFLSIISCVIKVIGKQRLDCFDKIMNFKQQKHCRCCRYKPLVIGFEIKANTMRPKRNSDNPLGQKSSPHTKFIVTIFLKTEKTEQQKQQARKQKQKLTHFSSYPFLIYSKQPK